MDLPLLADVMASPPVLLPMYSSQYMVLKSSRAEQIILTELNLEK